MALDVYVMPLWRYKAGDFHSPIESATGIRPKWITARGIDERPSPVGCLGRWRARRQVAAIRNTVEKANRVRIRWSDYGDVVYAEQSLGFESLRAYAKWLDLRDQFPKFTSPRDGDYYKHPVLTADDGRLTCPHLVKHDCFSGYFLPCEFEHLASVEPYLIMGQWPASRSVGSTPRLIRELDCVQSVLRVADEYEYLANDPLASVKTAYLQLRKVADLSFRHGLPIIFCG